VEVLEVAIMFARLRCLLRRHHQPRRHPLGGFRCAECGAAGADLDDMGFVGSGWVAPMRRTFNRPYQEVTVSAR
jgi:hypothetical protein